ncbi:hypothetical protein ACS127_17270 [Amphibacillus sp. Q70]|uniref:hypothetical protein n=1 Tax=Amphibacillus sp. Q70 TaxID=3453416 RepID=UPI003F86149B
MSKEKKTDWRDVEDDNQDFNRYPDLTAEELGKIVERELAQLDKEIAEGKRDLN